VPIMRHERTRLNLVYLISRSRCFSSARTRRAAFPAEDRATPRRKKAAFWPSRVAAKFACRMSRRYPLTPPRAVSARQARFLGSCLPAGFTRRSSPTASIGSFIRTRRLTGCSLRALRHWSVESAFGTYVQKRTMYSSAAMRPRCGRFTGIPGRLSSTQLDIVLADVGERADRVALRFETRTRHRAQVRSVPN
jgi:hypothetical protein